MGTNKAVDLRSVKRLSLESRAVALTAAALQERGAETLFLDEPASGCWSCRMPVTHPLDGSAW